MKIKTRFFLFGLMFVGAAFFFGCSPDAYDDSESYERLEAPKGIRVKAESPRTICVSFAPVDGASSYIIYWGEVGGSDDGKETVYTSYTLANPYRIRHSFKPGTEYCIQVQSVASDGRANISDGDYVTTWIPAPSIYLTKITSKSFAIHIESEVMTRFDVKVDDTIFKLNVWIGPDYPFAETYTTTAGYHTVTAQASSTTPHAELGSQTINLK